MTSHLPNNRTGLLPGEDALCHWVSIVQKDEDNGDEKDGKSQRNNNTPLHPQAFSRSHAESIHPNVIPDAHGPLLYHQQRADKSSCPPHKGKAEISSTILLLGGYAPEANYTVKVKATEEGQQGRTIFDLWTEFELQYKDGS